MKEKFVARVDYTVLAGVLVAAVALSGPLPAQPDTAFAATSVPTCAGKTATIEGTPENDTLIGTDGPDVIVGGPGRDFISGRGGNDVLCEGPTPIESADDTAPQSFVNGGAGADVLVGGGGPDDLRGGPGGDVLEGGAWQDSLYGGGGIDTLKGGAGPDVLSGDVKADLVTGGGGEDKFLDFAGDNRLFGGSGDDQFHSGAGDDRFIGGQGEDTAAYLDLLESFASSSHCHDVQVNLRRQQGQAKGMGSDRLMGVEDVWTTGGDDTLVGDKRNNTFYTGIVACGHPSSFDTIKGRGGIDTLTFDSGRIEGFATTSPGVRVNMAEGRARWDFNGINRYRFASIENVTGSGTSDRLYGDDQANRIDGGSGAVDDDVIVGRGGDDLLLGRRGQDGLQGWAGDDELRGGKGGDHLDGGTGENTNDGGPGMDACLRPQAGEGAVECEVL